MKNRRKNSYEYIFHNKKKKSMKEIMRRRRMRTYTLLSVIIVLILIVSIKTIFSSNPLSSDGGEIKEPIDVETFDREQLENKKNLILVNKENKLKSNYVPEGLVKIDVRTRSNITEEESKIKAEVGIVLKEMFKEAEKEGVILYASSGYRSYLTQDKIYEDSVKKNGSGYADKYVATAGNSEHQTGYSIDVTDASFGLKESFENTKEGIWVKENCYKFGFIIRYPQGKEKITGYEYEPWHIRYVGDEVAKEIHDKGITLEEYLKK